MYPVSSVHIVYKPTRECIEIARKYSGVFRERGVSVEISTVDDVSPRFILNKDIVVSIGGDGTMLRISMMLQDEKSIPLILPHPCGRRNNFYEESMPEIPVVVERIFKGDFVIHTYPRGRLCIKGGCIDFLNEVAVVNKDMGRVVGFRISVASPGIHSTYEFEGDGLIVSTVPGSAGYNLSAGGPLITGDSEELIITHLNPMQLGMPSIIVPAYASIIEASSRGYAILYIDGDKLKLLDKGETVRITGSTSYLKLIRFSTVYERIRTVLSRRRIVY
ncbi:NAD(+)/NADH kinase [Desulfurococcus amylolyticus]|uniref:NAD(+)/NADH kinase n=1 Tax=Desulfurococcus amylolyticus TaxID=94694 RepID=UPI0005B20BFE|nr:NAD(+)/NADH kinase [Desulfurococcus amylolyticus]